MPTLPEQLGGAHPRPTASRPEEAHGPVSHIPCWSTPEQYLAACLLAAESPEGRAIRKTLGSISMSALMRVCSEDALTADRLTGRNVQTAHETVARRLSAKGKVISASVVKRARQLIERLGLSVTVVAGRHLSQEERAAARAHHGGTQIAIASTRHLCVPRRFAAALEDLREKTDHLPSFKDLISSLKSRRANQSELRSQAKKPKKPKTASHSPVPLAVQRLSARLAARLPFLRTVRHLGAVSRVLIQAGIDPSSWTAAELIAELDRIRKEKGWDTPKVVGNPVGWLRFLLTGITPAVQAHHQKQKALANAELEARRLSAISAADRVAQMRAEASQRAETARKGAEKVRALLRSIRT